jgi:hypothetical protein
VEWEEEDDMRRRGRSQRALVRNEELSPRKKEEEGE